MLRKLFYVFFVFNALIFSQNISWKLFDDTQVGRVDITIDTAALNWIYNHVESDSEHFASFRFRNKWIDETVDSVGFRLRGNTSRNSQKKSFKVSFDTYRDGQTFYDVDEMNLNGEHNDPSIIRSKLCFDHFKSIGLPASRAAHVEVYINNRYYGLYIFVEDINKKFLKKNFSNFSGNLWKCLYPANLLYLGNDPQTYINLNDNGRKVYELKTNSQQNDFTQLVRFISILNNTPTSQLADSLEKILDVPNILQYFAINILTGSWDDYWSLMNNYYLYYEPGKELFHLIPYDYDNTYGIDWSGNNWTTANPYNFPKVVGGTRPLAEKLLAVSQYRNLYTHFLEFYRANVFLLNNWETRIDSIKQMITPYAIIDTFRTKDYGFTMNDFTNSYSASGYSKLHVKYGLKQFVNLRNTSLLGQLSYQTANPIAYKIEFEPKNPSPTDSIKVYVSAFSKAGINEALIKFTKTGTSTPENYQLTFSPVANTKKVEEADRYVGVIPPLGQNTSGTFVIYLKDNLNQSQIYPRKGPIVLSSSINAYGIVINEFMADNQTTIIDPNGDYDDWIELYNSSSNNILLTGKYLTDNSSNLKKWRFTQDSLYINAGQYLLIWCDEQPSQPGIHTNFKLSKSGEFIALIDTNGTTVLDSITFYAQQTDISFGRSPDLSRNWKFMQPSPGNSNFITSVDNKNIAEKFSLKQNYPNPFNPITEIKYSIQKAGHITLKIFNVLGNEVATLIDENKKEGEHSIIFNASQFPSGVYFYQIRSGIYSETKKMVLIK